MNKSLYGWTWLLLLACAPLKLNAAEKVTVKINNQIISAYRTMDLENAKKEAVAAHKPIAWIASASSLLDGRGTITLTNSRGAKE